MRPPRFLPGPGALLGALLLAALTPTAAPAAAGPAGAPRQPAPRSVAAPPTLRLPSTARPTRGAIELTVDPAAERYRGVVRYQVTLAAPTAIVWLHAEGLEVSGATVGGARARPVGAPGGFLGLALERPAAAGEVQLVVEFSGALDRVRSRGLHAAAEGDRWYAATSLGRAEARRVFPCFDEPTFELPWRLTLRVRPGDLALANTAVAAETAEAGLTRIEFVETRPLPSHQVAFAIGPFDLVDGGRGGAAEVPIRFAVPKGRGGETRELVEVTPRLLAALEAVLGRPDPDSKRDLAVVPRFTGTREHPGLVVQGPALALIPPAEATRERREAYATSASRELARLWSGDLVNQASGDEAWLDESLATWEGDQVRERLEPTWRALATERWARRAAGLEADARPTARRLRPSLTARPELEGWSDGAGLSDKGAAVLTMYQAYLGRDRFRGVVQAHRDARAHAVAGGGDFLRAVSARAGPELAASLQGFLDQPGAPLLKAVVACRKGSATVTFTQERFLVSGPRGQSARWSVPACVRAGAGEREATVCGLIAAPRGALALPFCPDWLWPNAGGTGYYLTALGQSKLPLLLTRLTPDEKLALATDAVLQAWRGDLPVADALGLVAPLAREPDRLLVEAALQVAGLVDPARLGDADLARWRTWVRRTLGDRARALGWLPRRGDDDETRALRRRLLPLVAGPGEEAVLAGEALALARRWLADRRQVPAEVAWPALEVAARRGDRSLFDRIVAEAGKAADGTERERLLAALGAFEDPALIRAALALGGAPGADPRETVPILTRQLRVRAARGPAWDFLTAHWGALAPRLPGDEAVRLVAAAAAMACEPGRRAEVAAFLRPRAAAMVGAAGALATAMERADACAATGARSRGSISAFLVRASTP